MQPQHRWRGAVAGLFALLFLAPSAKVAWGQDAVCGDVAEREHPHLNVLTINLLFSEIETRNHTNSA